MNITEAMSWVNKMFGREVGMPCPEPLPVIRTR